MSTVKQITINNEIIDIAAIEARAHKLRAEAIAEFGQNLRSWFKSLNIGVTAQAAH